MKATSEKGQVDYAQFNSFKNLQVPTLVIRDPKPDQNLGRTVSYGELTVEFFKNGQVRIFENGRMRDIRASW